MLRIIAHLTANNQLKITKLSKWKHPNAFDGAEERRQEKIGNIAQLGENQRKIERQLDSLYQEDRYDSSMGEDMPHIFMWDEREGYVYPVPTYQVVDDAERYEALLDLHTKSQSDVEQHSSWGRKKDYSKFNKHGRKKILEAGGAIEKAGKQDDCLLVTVTIPGGGARVYDAVSRWSGYIANRMTQTLRNANRNDKCKDDCGYFYVWELQKRGALHLHWCLIGYDYETAEKLKDAWYQALRDVGAKENLNCFKSESGRNWSNSPDTWQWDIQEVKKSVAGYFAKYASKTALGSKDAKPRKKGFDPASSLSVSPGRWYSISKSVRAWMQEYSCFIDWVGDESKAEQMVADIRWCMDALTILPPIVYGFHVTTDDDRTLALGEVESYLIDVTDFKIALDRMKFFKEKITADRRGEVLADIGF